MASPVRIECFVAEGCGSWEALERNLRLALAQEGLESPISFEIVSPDRAVRLRLGGSPTVRVDDVDIELEAPPAGVS